MLYSQKQQAVSDLTVPLRAAGLNVAGLLELTEIRQSGKRFEHAVLLVSKIVEP